MLKPAVLEAIPEETMRVAQKAFRKGNRYVALRDHLGQFLGQAAYEALYSTQGQPGLSPTELSLLTIVQQMEGLSDRAAAEALVSRIDLKYLLSKPLTYAGFDASVLSEFRQRLVAGGAEAVAFEQVLELCQAQQWLKVRGRQRTDSTHILAAVREVNRYELVGEALRSALNDLAHLHPAWLRQRTPAAWFGRYATRIEEYRLPAGAVAHQAWAEQVGQDGLLLLGWLAAADAPGYLGELPSIQTLRTIWQQQYHPGEGAPRWRQAGELPPAHEMIQSPYDPEARYSEKRELAWKGYKGHFTETCDDDAAPLLITQVTTTVACVPDCQVTAHIQAELAATGRLPDQHVVDAGYSDAERYAVSRTQHQIDLVAPTTPDVSWQAKAGQGYDHAHFTIDWTRRVATCPQGHESRPWLEDPDAFGNPSLLIRFDKQTCHRCPVRACCTRAAQQPRSLRIRPQDQYEALQAARQRQLTPEFQALYAQRSGIEATLSLSVRAFDMRQTRYLGLAKTHLQNLFIATAINLQRIADFLLGTQRTTTRTSAFARLAPT